MTHIRLQYTAFNARVKTGSGRGRRLGFPTLNLNLEDIPADLEEGIYAAFVTINEQETALHAAVHYGQRPFFNDKTAFEVHLIDTELEAPPPSLHIEIAARLRDIRNFESEEELKEQIAKDISEARNINKPKTTHSTSSGQENQKRYTKNMLPHLKALIPQRSPIRLGWHFFKAFIAALANGFPARKLTVIGITGTDGKTTTASMTAHILQHAGIQTGALSTAFLQIKDQIEWNETQKTSPSPFLLQQFLKKLVQNNCTHAVLEVSSHGLVQGRVHHIRPTVAAITNTSMEHLDYHGSLEQYRKDKGKLFQMLKGGGTKVLNAEDATYCLYKDIPSSRTIAYKTGNGERGTVNDSILWCSDVSINSTSTSSTLNFKDKTFTVKRLPFPVKRLPFTVPLPGAFNLENALCAISCALAVGVPIETCVEALKTFKGAPGRMELIDEGQPFSVYVDFTVTPAAYEKTLKTLREMIEPGRRILVLTGSCGDRMKEKRPIVGKICSKLADVVVVANEDPYTEDPQKIIDEVWAGIDQTQCEAHRIFDRREAMQFLFRQAKAGDAIILCAKGSDTTMWTAEGQVPWNERAIARELLLSLS